MKSRNSLLCTEYRSNADLETKGGYWPYLPYCASGYLQPKSGRKKKGCGSVV